MEIRFIQLNVISYGVNRHGQFNDWVHMGHQLHRVLLCGSSLRRLRECLQETSDLIAKQLVDSLHVFTVFRKYFRVQGTHGDYASLHA